MHEKFEDVPFLKKHLKSFHKYCYVANWLVLEKMSNVAIFMETIIAFNFTNGNFTDKRRLFGSYISLFEKNIWNVFSMQR